MKPVPHGSYPVRFARAYIDIASKPLPRMFAQCDVVSSQQTIIHSLHVRLMTRYDLDQLPDRTSTRPPGRTAAPTEMSSTRRCTDAGSQVPTRAGGASEATASPPPARWSQPGPALAPEWALRMRQRPPLRPVAVRKRQGQRRVARTLVDLHMLKPTRRGESAPCTVRRQRSRSPWRPCARAADGACRYAARASTWRPCAHRAMRRALDTTE